MSGHVPAFRWKTPRNLLEALAILDRERGVWKPLAGGTDLMVSVDSGQLSTGSYLNLWALDELRDLEVTSEHLVLGALTTFTEIRNEELIRRQFPLLCQAAAATASIAIQNRGTLGGNIANASPAADTSPVLLVYDAELQLISVAGNRWVPYHLFHTGYKQMNIEPNELIYKVRFPLRSRHAKGYFRKVGTRNAQAISKVCLAAIASSKGTALENVRIAMGSVAPIPLRCLKTEAFLEGKIPTDSTIREAQNILAHEVSPIDDIRSTERYRRQVSVNLLREFLESF